MVYKKLFEDILNDLLKYFVYTSATFCQFNARYMFIIRLIKIFCFNSKDNL